MLQRERGQAGRLQGILTGNKSPGSCESNSFVARRIAGKFFAIRSLELLFIVEAQFSKGI